MSCRLMLLIATSLASCNMISPRLAWSTSEARLTSEINRVQLLMNDGLIATNVVQPNITQANIAQASLATPQPTESPAPAIEFGTGSLDVAQLQSLLRRAGYYNGDIDGVYGDQTRLALIEFQRQLGLDATGEVDEETWQALQELDPGGDVSPFANDETASLEANETAPTEGNTNPDVTPSAPAANAASADVNAEGEGEDSATQAGQDWLRKILLVFVISGVAGTVVYALTHYGLIRMPRSRQISLFFRRLTTPPPLAMARSMRSPATSRSPRPEPAMSQTPNSPTPPSDASHAESQEEATADSAVADEPMLMMPTRVVPPTHADIVRQLTLDLHHTDPNIRRRAIWELGQQGNSDAILSLTELMTQSDSHQRCLILAAVSEIGIRTLKPMNRVMIASLQDENVEVRKNAIREITRIYDLITQVSQHLRYAVDDEDAEVRKTAQWALGRIDRTLAQSDTTLPDLSTLVQSNGVDPGASPDNVEMSAMKRSSGDRPSSQ